MKERILYFIGYKNINVAKFLQETGIKRGFLDADKLNGSVSGENIAKIIAAYPQLNTEWVITGKGDMLKGVNTVQSTEERPHIRSDTDIVAALIEQNGALIKQNAELIQQVKKTLELLEQSIQKQAAAGAVDVARAANVG